MAARPRETEVIAQEIETADESATETHTRLLLAMADGHICPVEFEGILESAVTTVTYTSRSADRIARYDKGIERVTAILHNGPDSPRVARLEAKFAKQRREECREEQEAEYEIAS